MSKERQRSSLPCSASCRRTRQQDRILLDLGYEVPGLAQAAVEPPLDDYRETYATDIDPVQPALVPANRPAADSVPLPSYDLEEIGAVEAMSSPGYDVSADAYERKRQVALGEQQALPSFPMDELPTEAKAPAPPRAHAPLGTMRAMPPPPASVAGAAWGAGIESIEEALEEAEFFISRGLLEDGRTILDEQLKRAPGHPLILEKLQELDLAAQQANVVSGTRERPEQTSAFAQTSPSNRAFDIAASLDALDHIDEAAGAGVEQPNEQIDVEEVFAKFKEGVRAQVSETDSATHYDLGLAYREMGLLSDAIDEFELAATDPKRTCVCQHMVGMIHRAQGNMNAAIDAFIKGLHAEQKTVEQENGLYYDLGDAYEAKGIPAEALYFFRKVSHRNASYRDERGAITLRVRALQAKTPRAGMAHAVGASNEFDAAFDAALIGDHK